MARKLKIGLDYFSHDTDLFDDVKIKYLKARHGLVGYAIYLRLLENIYKETGYYLKVYSKFNLLFSDECSIEIDVYINVLNDCIEENLFNKKLYDKYKILTSKRIQKNYLASIERRQSADFIKEYLLVVPSDVISLKSRINVNINSINDSINSINSNIGTQRKEKERKGKKIYSSKSSRILARHISIVKKFILKKQSDETFKNSTYLKNANVNQWSAEIEKLERLDKHSPETIKQVLNFSLNDVFWKSQIVSLAKLRTKSKSNDLTKFENCRLDMVNSNSSYSSVSLSPNQNDRNF